jgi:hypothetical protein|tara:strand:+ start:316 stop:468 length:153 start_codon:yes stop_codon:yes gene_type:complete
MSNVIDMWEWVARRRHPTWKGFRDEENTFETQDTFETENSSKEIRANSEE